MIFRVVVTGLNCERWATFCLQSITEATRGHTVYIYAVDDGSSDLTHRHLRAYTMRSSLPTITIIHNAINLGAAHARWQAIEAMRPHAGADDVVVFVDMDDFLLPNALDVIARAYQNQWAAITYGNWFDVQTGEINPLQYYPMEIASNGRWRELPFWATAPRTCIWRLVAQLTPEDFIYESVWLQTCTDVALMFRLFSLVDNFRAIVPIAEPIYAYRQNTGINSLVRFGVEEKLRVSNLIQQRFYESNPYYRT